MSAPLFSIVTVALNAGDALRASAASVDAQSCPDYEHLVKDGGSTDGSVESLPPSERRRIVAAPDSGIYEAMNEAAGLASGRYLNFLNAGDRFPGPDTLARVREALSAVDFPDLLYGDALDERSGKRRRSAARLDRRALFLDGICHQAQWIRREVFLEMGGLDASFRFRADQELLLRLVEEARATRHLPEVLALYDGKGFSAKPENRRHLDAEWKRLRRSRFSFSERLRWGCLAALRGRWWKRVALDLATRHAPSLLKRRTERANRKLR